MEEFVNLLESGITILEAWKAANDKYHDPKLPISSFPWAAVFRKSAIAAVAADLEKDAQFSGSDLVYCSMFQPIIQPIEPLPYISYMFYSEKTSTEALIIEEINDFEKNNTACSTAHSLATGNSGETILVLRNTLAIGKTKIDQLRANDVFVYKFCVVRPDWECPLEISSVFVPRLGLPVTKALVQFPFGQDGDVMRVKITEDCDRCIILLSFLQKALEYLKKQALGNHPTGQANEFDNPSDLVYHVLRGTEIDGKIKLPDGRMLQDEDLAKIDWIRDPCVLDLKIFPAMINPELVLDVC